VRRAALVGVGVALVGLSNWVFAGASAIDSHHRERHLRLVATNGFFVDNDPSGQSGGDLFGASGELRRGGEAVGKFSSACTLAPPVGGQCQATLIFGYRDQIQLAGNNRIQGEDNRLSIVGGTGKFRDVRGVVSLRRLDEQGQVQQLKLTVVR